MAVSAAPQARRRDDFPLPTFPPFNFNIITQQRRQLRKRAAAWRVLKQIRWPEPSVPLGEVTLSIVKTRWLVRYDFGNLFAGRVRGNGIATTSQPSTSTAFA